MLIPYSDVATAQILTFLGKSGLLFFVRCERQNVDDFSGGKVWNSHFMMYRAGVDGRVGVQSAVLCEVPRNYINELLSDHQKATQIDNHLGNVFPRGGGPSHKASEGYDSSCRWQE